MHTTFYMGYAHTLPERTDQPTSFDAWAEQPILFSMEQGHVPWPSSCRNGTCRTCIAKLHQGQVQYHIEWPGVTTEEQANGYILPCVAYPLSDIVIVPCED